jgi:hypothetical protein
MMPGHEPVPPGEKPASNRLSYGTAYIVTWFLYRCYQRLLLKQSIG